MNELDERRRLHDEDQDIPVWLRWTFVTINRVGFPIVAFLLMWYMAQVSITKVVVAVDQNTVVLSEVKAALGRVETHGPEWRDP